jgi:hypothetical protein
MRVSKRLGQLSLMQRIRQRTSSIQGGSRHERMRRHVSSLFKNTKPYGLLSLTSIGSRFKTLKRTQLLLIRKLYGRTNRYTM